MRDANSLSVIFVVLRYLAWTTTAPNRLTGAV
jgi:hypothetical protein